MNFLKDYYLIFEKSLLKYIYLEMKNSMLLFLVFCFENLVSIISLLKCFSCIWS